MLTFWGRVEMWLSILAGFTLGFAESIDRIRANLTEIPPTVMISVPRIYEKVYAAVSVQLERHPVLRHVFSGVARIDERAASWLKGKLLAGQIRPAFGGRLRFAILRRRSPQPEIAIFFRAAGIEIFEGYGLTGNDGRHHRVKHARKSSLLMELSAGHFPMLK